MDRIEPKFKIAHHRLPERRSTGIFEFPKPDKIGHRKCASDRRIFEPDFHSEDSLTLHSLVISPRDAKKFYQNLQKG